MSDSADSLVLQLTITAPLYYLTSCTAFLVMFYDRCLMLSLHHDWRLFFINQAFST